MSSPWPVAGHLTCSRDILHSLTSSPRGHHKDSGLSQGGCRVGVEDRLSPGLQDSLLAKGMILKSSPYIGRGKEKT